MTHGRCRNICLVPVMRVNMALNCNLEACAMPTPLTILMNDAFLSLEMLDPIIMNRGHPDRDRLFKQGTRSGCWQCVRYSRHIGK